MKMKKTLAGVMAGAMAVSAMAATVSADQDEISLTYDLKRYAQVSDDGTVVITSTYTTSNDTDAYLVQIDSNNEATLKFEAQQQYLKNKDLVSAEITLTSRVDREGKDQPQTITNTIKYTNDAAVAEKDSEFFFAPKGKIDTNNDGTPDFEVFRGDTDGDGYKEVYIPLRNDAAKVRVINASAYKLDGVDAFGFTSCVAKVTYKIPAKVTVRTADGWHLWQANGDYINWAYTDPQYSDLGIDAYSSVTNSLKYMNEGLTCGDEAFLLNSAVIDVAKAKKDALAALNAAEATLTAKEAALKAAEKAVVEKSAAYGEAVKDGETTSADATTAIKAANKKLFTLVKATVAVPDDKIVEPGDTVDGEKIGGTVDVIDIDFEGYTEWVELKKAAEDAQKAAAAAAAAIPTAKAALDKANADLTLAQTEYNTAKADRDNKKAYYDSINTNVTGAYAKPEKYSATSLVAGTVKDAVYPFKTVLNPTYSTKYDATTGKVLTVGNNDVVAALKCRKADGNYYTNPIAVLNDAIANNEEVTFTFKTFNDYVATSKSHQYLQWVEADRAYGYKTSQYDWYNPSFSQHLYTNEYNTYSPFGVTNYDQYGSYSSAWGINLFSGAIVVNSGLTMQLNDTQKFYWGNDTLTFDWFTITDEGKITDAKTFLTSMLLYTPVDWYWDSLTVTVGNTEEDDIDTTSPVEDEAEEIPEEEEEVIFEEEEVVEEEVEEEVEEVEEPEEVEEVSEPEEVEEVVEEAAPVAPAPSPATGNAPVALAVIPVALAAAAVVAKKRG